MKENDEERRVARALEQLRKADEASAPSFQATRTRARAGLGRRRPAIGWAAAALLVFLAGGLLVVFRNPSGPRRNDSATSSAEASLASWESPTGFLLDTPGSEIWRGLPRLPESIPSHPPADSPSSTKGARS